jgi:hypothetical protein
MKNGLGGRDAAKRPKGIQIRMDENDRYGRRDQNVQKKNGVGQANGPRKLLPEKTAGRVLLWQI